MDNDSRKRATSSEEQGLIRRREVGKIKKLLGNRRTTSTVLIPLDQNEFSGT
jgi:hypothetical protein